MHICLQPETHYSYIHACRVSLFLVVTFFFCHNYAFLERVASTGNAISSLSAIMFPEEISKTIDWFHLA